MPEFEISATRRDEFDEIMAMTRRAAVFNEKEVDTVTELLEGYEEGPEISGYNFLSCRMAAHPSTSLRSGCSRPRTERHPTGRRTDASRCGSDLVRGPTSMAN